MSPLVLEASQGQLGPVGEPRLAKHSPGWPRIALASLARPAWLVYPPPPPVKIKTNLPFFAKPDPGEIFIRRRIRRYSRAAIEEAIGV